MSSASKDTLATRGHLFARPRTWQPTHHYQAETLRPIVCLVYVLPFLLIHELGVILLDNPSIRNGLDIWLGAALRFTGAGELLLLPLITTFALFAWHHVKGDRWSFRPTVLAGMAIESFSLALIMLWAAKAQHLFLVQWAEPGLRQITLEVVSRPDGVAASAFWSRFVAFCGAGLYEELVFRLLLLPGLIGALIRTGVRRGPATLIAIAVTSLCFAAAHYDLVNPAGAPFELPGFVVRTVASLFFCLVFLFRGFGIAVGTHVAYNVLTQL